MLSKLAPKLEGKEYANLITIFAVILAVEYSTGKHDIWDLGLGIVSAFMGYSFVKEAIKQTIFSFHR